MKKKLIAIIPAQEKNSYSKYGDLVKWGDSNLLKWKVSQLKLVDEIDRIIITTKSKNIIQFCKNNSIEYVERINNNLSQTFSEIGKIFSNNLIIWTIPTAPFVSPKLIRKFIKYYKTHSPKDGLVTSLKLKEYFFDSKKKAIQRNLHSKYISRSKLDPIYMLTNGLSMAHSEIFSKGSPFGKSPLHFNIDLFSSLEISSAEELDLFNPLIEKYIMNESN